MRLVTGPLHLSPADFKQLFQAFGPSLGFWRAAEIAALREQCYSPPVLDLGCGDGFLTSMVLSRAAVGLDPDSTALEKASSLGLYEQLEPLPIEQSSRPPASLQTVLSNSVLEHITEVDQALQAVGRLLKPGGRFILTSPSQAFSHWLLLPARPYVEQRNRHFLHLNLWSLEEWAARLAHAGLEIEQVRPYLRQRQVTLWDTADLLESIWVARRRLVGLLWKRLSPTALDRLSRRAAQIDLSSSEPGGGRLIVARKI